MSKTKIKIPKEELKIRRMEKIRTATRIMENNISRSQYKIKLKKGTNYEDC